MITETDWELGLPPYGVPVDAFIRGQVRHGKRDYMDTFRVDDCTHPQQNTTLPLDWVEAWRWRLPLQKWKSGIDFYQNTFPAGWLNQWINHGVSNDTSIA
jgi:hypothetical protein